MNGRSGEYLRFFIGVAAAATVAYFTTINALQSEMSATKARQDSQFEEVLRRMDIMQADIREIRANERR